MMLHSAQVQSLAWIAVWDPCKGSEYPPRGSRPQEPAKRFISILLVIPPPFFATRQIEFHATVLFLNMTCSAVAYSGLLHIVPQVISTSFVKPMYTDVSVYLQVGTGTYTIIHGRRMMCSSTKATCRTP